MASYGNTDKCIDKKVPPANAPPVSQGTSPYGYPAGTYTTTASAQAVQAAQAAYAVSSGYAAASGYAYPQGPPPPYSVALSQPSPAATVPGYYTYPQMGYAYPYATPAQAGLMYPGTTYVVPGVGSYDAGARFDGIARPGIPPIPPGMQPTAAQLAMMQGNSSIVMTQQKNNPYYSDGGGYTFW